MRRIKRFGRYLLPVIFIVFCLVAYILIINDRLYQCLDDSLKCQGLTALTNIATIATLVLLVVQIYLLKQQIKAEHEKERRKLTVDLLFRWSEGLNRSISAARKFIESLPEESVRSIAQEKSIIVDEKYRSQLRIILKRKLRRKNGNSIELSESDAAHIRWLLITYLNKLESVMASWRHNIADRELIEEEFEYLFEDSLGHAALRKFRTASGGTKSYPNIELFSVAMDRKKKMSQYALIEKEKLP